MQKTIQNSSEKTINLSISFFIQAAIYSITFVLLLIGGVALYGTSSLSSDLDFYALKYPL